jgi:hypothetical protein
MAVTVIMQMLVWVPTICTHGTLNTPTEKAQLTGCDRAAAARIWNLKKVKLSDS